MALGFEKINTSAARAKSTGKNEIPRDKLIVTPKGTRFYNATYKHGVTVDDFISNSDKVRCLMDSGYEIILRGGSNKNGCNK